MRAFALAATACFAVSLLACGGDDNTGGDGGTGGSSGFANPANSPLAGTWRANQTEDPASTDAVIVLSANELTISLPPVGYAPLGIVISARGDGNLFVATLENFDFTYDGSSPKLEPTVYTAPITRTTAANLDLGQIPLPIAGGLKIESSPGHSCQYTLADGAATASCIGLERSYAYLLPKSAGHGTANGVRTSTAPSIFGTLGGNWRFNGAGGSQCVASFTGSTVTVTCEQASSYNGSFTITFDGNQASGSTSEGIEFVAYKQ
jgi:hypothetical protein